MTKKDVRIAQNAVDALAVGMLRAKAFQGDDKAIGEERARLVIKFLKIRGKLEKLFKRHRVSKRRLRLYRMQRHLRAKH